MDTKKFIFLLINIFLYLDKINCSPVSDNIRTTSEHPRGIDDSLTSDEANNGVQLPPLLFPEDTRTYKIVPPNNETALKILRHFKENKKTETPEVPPAEPDHHEHHENLLKGFEAVEELKNEVENFQPADNSRPGIELEEQFRQPNANLRLNDIFVEDIEAETPKLNEGHIAAIVAGALAVICIAIYIGLITWRHYLEKRYGMRERLMTEDDFAISNDCRHLQVL